MRDALVTEPERPSRHTSPARDRTPGGYELIVDQPRASARS